MDDRRRAQGRRVREQDAPSGRAGHRRPAPARVLVVEDHVLLAEGVAFALRNAGLAVDVVGEPTAEAVFAAVQANRPNVVLLELRLGDRVGSGLPLIEPLNGAGAEVLVLTDGTDPVVLARCVEAGAAGIVSKAEGFHRLLEKVLAAARHQRTLSSHECYEMLEHLRKYRALEKDRLAPLATLTPREQEVLAELMEGRSAEETARGSFVSVATVRSQIRSILQKLGVNSQLAAVALAHRAGWDPHALGVARAETAGR